MLDISSSRASYIALRAIRFIDRWQLQQQSPAAAKLRLPPSHPEELKEPPIMVMVLRLG